MSKVRITLSLFDGVESACMQANPGSLGDITFSKILRASI